MLFSKAITVRSVIFTQITLSIKYSKRERKNEKSDQTITKSIKVSYVKHLFEE